MQDIKQNLADAIRKSRTELGLSQEKLAEILGFDSRTILNIENGRGNPKFEKLYPLVRHLNISADRIFYPESVTPQPNLQKLFIMLNDCTEQEVAELLPAVHYLLALMRKRDNSEQCKYVIICTLPLKKTCRPSGGTFYFFFLVRNPSGNSFDHGKSRFRSSGFGKGPILRSSSNT